MKIRWLRVLLLITIGIIGIISCYFLDLKYDNIQLITTPIVIGCIAWISFIINTITTVEE